jgi:hypothetical protein
MFNNMMIGDLNEYKIRIVGCNLITNITETVRLEHQCDHKYPKNSTYCNVCGKKILTEENLCVTKNYDVGIIDLIKINKNNFTYTFNNKDYNLYKLDNDEFYISFNIKDYRSEYAGHNSKYNNYTLEDSYLEMWNDMKNIKNDIIKNFRNLLQTSPEWISKIYNVNVDCCSLVPRPESRDY